MHLRGLPSASHALKIIILVCFFFDLLGTEQKVAVSIEDNSRIAVVIREIFDKKVAQKIICFFLYSFHEDYLQMGQSIPKVVFNPKLSQLHST
jgi:hypothetical protein